MGIEFFFLILAVFVVAFGIGVVLLNRRKSVGQPAPGRPTPPPARPPVAQSEGDTLVAEPEVDSEVDSGVEDEPAVEEEPPAGTLRERLAKARSTFAGAIAGVLGRSAITDESFDDLETLDLRADVGVAIADELLSGLRVKVANKEITEPSDLLDALQAEMTKRLVGSDRSLKIVSWPILSNSSG